MVLMVIGLICLFLPKCHRIRELQRKKAVLQEENSNLDLAARNLRLKRERFKSDPVFVERVAREAGMVRTDETVFKFTSNTEENAKQVIQ